MEVRSQTERFAQLANHTLPPPPPHSSATSVPYPGAEMAMNALNQSDPRTEGGRSALLLQQTGAMDQFNYTRLKTSMIQQGTISRQLRPASLRLCGAERSVSRNILSSHQSLLEPKVGHRSVELKDSVAVKMQTVADPFPPAPDSKNFAQLQQDGFPNILRMPQ